MDFEKLKLKIELTKARIDILKMKANDYEWSCFVPNDVKGSLEKSLVEIEQALAELSK